MDILGNIVSFITQNPLVTGAVGAVTGILVDQVVAPFVKLALVKYWPSAQLKKYAIELNKIVEGVKAKHPDIGLTLEKEIIESFEIAIAELKK